MTPQSRFLICAPVADGRLDALRTLLASMNRVPGMADPANALVPFARFERVHFARFFVVEALTRDEAGLHGMEPRPWPPTLVFMADCDGSWRDLLEELVQGAGPGLRELFAHCRDFDGDDSRSLIRWLERRNVVPAASYVNWIGRTVVQVREELALHRLLREELMDLQRRGDAGDPARVCELLRARVKQAQAEGQLSLSEPARTSFGWRARNLLEKIGVPLVLLLLAPLAILALPFYLLLLRRRESADPEALARPKRAHVAGLAALEDHLVTNQFTAFGDVKPGLFRRWTLVAVLFLLNYAAKHVFNRGYLTRVQTIHFAHWSFLDDGNRVLFCSNYDGSHESYMDDFINKVAWGLNLVFSNGIGYPNTRWLLKGGAEHEGRFKNYLRRHQLPTEVWYKAYPDATAVELARNSRIRQGIAQARFRDAGAMRAWLSLI